MRKALFAVLLAFAAWHAPRLDAAVKLHGLFTDNMVLQRNMSVPIWGTAEAGEALTLTLDAAGAKTMDIGTTKADKDGKWSIHIAPFSKGGPYTLTVKGKEESATLKNVLFGEVWIASGQSNMEWALQQTRDPKDVIAKAKNANIRFFDVPKTPNADTQKELGTAKPNKGRQFGRWLECEPETAQTFSAVGYYFARDLEKELRVPIGIINCSWSGVAAERYISKKALESVADLKSLATPKNSDLYNGMIAPLQPFAFRGVIWYQGESNAGNGERYFKLMNTLIKEWRADWKQGDFPFLTVQLAPWEPGNFAEVREAQLLTSQKAKNTAMAVITDYGDRKDVHPPDKRPVGERLALAAKAMAYGQKVEYIGPLYDSAKFESGAATLTFKHAGGGLVAKGDTLTGFTIAGKDGKFVKGDAKIVGNTVVVRSSQVSEPTAVRFGWANYPEVNLFSKEGLPATPFRTDMPDYAK